jgi:alkanesulfonate monooxygenase SsuD/methylene tetrahydromethanopterin reductase-like flavin-dependent oxidoreductase (luciferase family)
VSRRLKIGVMLHAGAEGRAADTPEQARHAERLGLDGIFVGDHLKPAGPYPESVVVLAAAAGVTERIQLGFGVMILALRHPAWAAKQVAALQHVSGGRVVLGVGTGGVMHGTEAWEAVGVPWGERGRRTDEALALLPGLISGETVELPSGASITLSPGAEVPPILVAGNSPAALRRAIRHGVGLVHLHAHTRADRGRCPTATRDCPGRRARRRPARRRDTGAGSGAVRGPRRGRRDLARPVDDGRRLAFTVVADRRSRHAAAAY